jgi:putative serine protease PepD
MQTMAALGKVGSCHPGLREREVIAVTAGPAQHWWSDALNDPWRDPSSNTVIMTTAPVPAPPPPPFDAAPPATLTARTLVVVAVVTGLLAGALGGAIGFLAATAARPHPVTLGAAGNAPPAPRNPGSLAAMVPLVMPSVVTVSAPDNRGGNLGSGFVIAENGYILTNEHVINGSSDQSLSVTLADNTTLAATVIGRDPESDLAVLKVARENRTPVHFADSDSVVVGDGVFAIGAPLALPGTVTAGIVSAVDRTIETRDLGGVQRYYAAIQTDAAVNRGNSGGPLFDYAGRVIGINSVIKSLVEDGIETGNIGIAFAIPINQAVRVSSEIIDLGKARRTVVGAEFDAYAGPGGGVRITTVAAGGPAAAAGLRTGDVVVRIGTHSTEAPHDLIAMVRRYDPGKTVTLVYRRGAVTQSANVVLAVDAN